MFETITENVFLYRDTVNVYVVRSGDRGVLIECGRGKVFDQLHKLGISNIDWVLHTHHHRDSTSRTEYRDSSAGSALALV